MVKILKGMLDITMLLEILAVITDYKCMANQKNVLLYPVGIISVLLWIYLCWVGKLFGQSVINFFFFVMMFLDGLIGVQKMTQ